MVGIGKAGQRADEQFHGVFGDGAFGEDTGAETGDFAFAGEHFPRLGRVDLGYGEAGGITSDVDGSVAGHGSPS